MHGLSIRSAAKLQAFRDEEWRDHSYFGFKGDMALDRDWFPDLLFLNRKTGYTISPINVLKMAFFFGTLVQVYHKRMSLNMQSFF